MSTSFSHLSFLRSREVAAYEVWRATPQCTPERLQRQADWRRALGAVNAEIEHRARLLATRNVRTSGKEQHP